jgi:hypothetical protein
VEEFGQDLEGSTQMLKAIVDDPISSHEDGSGEGGRKGCHLGETDPYLPLLPSIYLAFLPERPLQGCLPHSALFLGSERTRYPIGPEMSSVS